MSLHPREEAQMRELWKDEEGSDDCGVRTAVGSGRRGRHHGLAASPSLRRLDRSRDRLSRIFYLRFSVNHNPFFIKFDYLFL